MTSVGEYRARLMSRSSPERDPVCRLKRPSASDTPMARVSPCSRSMHEAPHTAVESLSASTRPLITLAPAVGTRMTKVNMKSKIFRIIVNVFCDVNICNTALNHTRQMVQN